MNTTAEPSENGGNGRDASGRFVRGNAGGPGNPHARRTSRLRALLLDSVSDDDLRAVVQSLVTRAKSGDVPACRELLNRLIGRPTEAADPDRLDVDAHRLLLEVRRIEATADLDHAELEIARGERADNLAMRAALSSGASIGDLSPATLALLRHPSTLDQSVRPT